MYIKIGFANFKKNDIYHLSVLGFSLSLKEKYIGIDILNVFIVIGISRKWFIKKDEEYEF